ncbi:MAG: 16S rRNA (guanine(527)-N(7))-methyltransferase RsmG [Phycisphaeraceae bacterium]|nr:16S rRNA (guanine(527)-N(7))-methyltransferase RsmG [Phycisphaeraceae bacterium]
MPDPFPAFLISEAQRLGITLPPEVWGKLAGYLDLLLEANEKFNLTAVRDRDEAWRTHILDSLTLLAGLQDLTPGTRLADVGSGGGLPGVPLAIAAGPNLAVTLIEATGKKANFLRECATKLDLPNVTVVAERAEIVGHDPVHRQQYDLVTARALGPLRVLLEYTLPLLKVGGQLLAMKGPSVEEELDQSQRALEVLGAGEVSVFEPYPEGSGVRKVIVRVTKTRPTIKSYPRNPGTPKQTPL